MKIHKSESSITNLGIEILRKKLSDPSLSYRKIAEEFNIKMHLLDSAIASAEAHLQIEICSKPNRADYGVPFLSVRPTPQQSVCFPNDLPERWLPPEPCWMVSIDFNQLPPTTDEKAVMYMSGKF